MTRLSVRTLSISVLPILVVAALGCGVLQADTRQSVTESWRRTYDLRPGGDVEIENVNGRIEVEASSGNTVEVLAEKTGRGETDANARQALGRIEIHEEASDSSIHIQSRYPQGRWEDEGWEVEYTVRVPAGAHVSFATVNGGVQLAGLGGQIRAHTTNGGITARDIRGTIDARTTNGGLDIDLRAVPSEGATLSCTNGAVRLRLPADARANLSARMVNGGIQTDGLSLEVREVGRRTLEATLNGGGPRIDVSGVNGGVRISGR